VKIVFTPHGWEDHRSGAGDRKTLSRINRLITEAARDGAGTGKPERLTGDLTAFVCLLALLLGVGPAAAITNGQPDAGRHPYVA
jgi:YoeB-like toxin of bacterial type II toxin-antitoxin system